MIKAANASLQFHGIDKRRLITESFVTWIINEEQLNGS
jgi:hypothetical protein